MIFFLFVFEDPCQGLTLRNELSKETHVRARDFTGKGHLGERSRVRAPRGATLPRGFHGDGVSVQVASGQCLSLRALPGGAHIAQPKCIPIRRILRGG